MTALSRAIWQQADAQPQHLSQATRSCMALEELRTALARGVEQGLAIERACLLVQGMIQQ